MAAELAVVALGLDTTALKRGEVQATASLRNIEKEMARVESSSNSLGVGLSQSVTKTQQSFQGLTQSTSSISKAFGSLGGPIGQLAGQFGKVSAASGDLVGSLGAAGTASVAAVAGFVALTRALATMTKEGVDAAQSFEKLARSQNISIEQAQKLMIGTRDYTNQLQQLGGVLGKDVVQQAAHATDQFEILNRQIQAVKIELAANLSSGLTELGAMLQRMIALATRLASIIPAKGSVLSTLALGPSAATVRAYDRVLGLATAASGGLPPAPPGPANRGLPVNISGADAFAIFGAGGGVVAGARGGGRGAPVGAVDDSAQKMADELKLIRDVGDATGRILESSMNELVREVNKTNEIQQAILDFNKSIGVRVPLGIPGAPPIAEGGIPGVTIPEPFDPRRDPRKEQIDQAFASIFDEAVISLLKGRTTFTGALIGVIDGVFYVFAEEFARSMRESFVDPLIRQLTDYLSDALGELFGSFSGKGIGGFFTSLLKSFGGFFGGFFGTGGTLGPNQFGIAGERGEPEFIFSGNRSLSIVPMSQMSAAGGVTINMMVAPDASGNVSRRSQDQIAEGIMRGLQQSTRLRGAR